MIPQIRDRIKTAQDSDWAERDVNGVMYGTSPDTFFDISIFIEMTIDGLQYL